MANASLFLDARLHERGLRDSRLTQAELDLALAALPDKADNLVEFDADGIPTNLSRKRLKSLPVKPGEPEQLNPDGSSPGDMLADAWDEVGD